MVQTGYDSVNVGYDGLVDALHVVVLKGRFGTIFLVFLIGEWTVHVGHLCCSVAVDE